MPPWMTDVVLAALITAVATWAAAGLSWGQLKQLNPDTNWSALKAGTILMIA